jgi:hypothetical protein
MSWIRAVCTPASLCDTVARGWMEHGRQRSVVEDRERRGEMRPTRSDADDKRSMQHLSLSLFGFISST